MGKPLYQMIYEELKQKIESGVYSEHTALPAERALCQHYHVSRSTIRAALEELSRNGYILKSHGNGNFVKPLLFEQRLTSFHSFAGSLRAQHVMIENEILSYDLIEPGNYLTALSQTAPKESMSPRWHKLVRLRSTQEFPLMIETSYLPANRFPMIDMEILKKGSLYSYLERYYKMRITDATESLTATLPSARERTYLQVSAHHPCILFERLCYENGVLIAVHRTVVRGDKFKFVSSFHHDNAAEENEGF